MRYRFLRFANGNVSAVDGICDVLECRQILENKFDTIQSHSVNILQHELLNSFICGDTVTNLKIIIIGIY